MGQVEYMRAFLAQNEDITVYDIYIDDGISSFSKHRPAFTKMINDMNENKINCIIVNDISRFSRNYIEASEYLEITFPLRQVRFISIFDGYDSLRGDGERLLIMLKILLAYAYARELSNKIGTVFKGKQRTGKYTPAQLPYGYRKFQNGDQVEWIVDEEKVIIVRKIFEMAKQGFSGYSIAKELNLQGVPSPKSTNWTSVSVRRVLINRAYLGEFITHKTKNDLLQGQKAIPLPESEWVYHKEHHSPIIDEDLFDSVQLGLAINEKFPRKSATTEDFFQGKLYCGMCGRKLKRKKTKDGAIYYICPMRDEVGGACRNKSRRAEKLKLIVFNVLMGKIQNMREQRNEANKIENSLYNRQREERNNKLLAELKLQSDFQMNLHEKLLEDRVSRGGVASPISDDIRGLYLHMMNVSNYITKQTDAIEKEKFENKAIRSLNATRMSVYLEYEYAQELTAEMLDVLVEKILVFPEKVEISYKSDEISIAGFNF